MSLLSSLPLAATSEWTTWVAVLGGLAGFASLLITLARGRGTPAAVPAPTPPPAPVAPARIQAPAPPPVPAPAVAAPAAIPDEIMALIAAAVAVTVGPNARVASVVPTPLDQQQQWSIEGRRQIYSSHQIR